MNHEQAEGERHLLAAVIALAIQDAAAVPTKFELKEKRNNKNSESAIDFLYGGQFVIYAKALDKDPQFLFDALISPIPARFPDSKKLSAALMRARTIRLRKLWSDRNREIKTAA